MISSSSFRPANLRSAKLGIETLRVLVQEMKYCLMKPDYQNETVLKDFFSDEALADRSALIGKVEYWNFIFEHLAGDRTDAAQA